MKKHLFGIAVGGKQRLREATEAHIRAKYQSELAAASDKQQKAAIKEKIQQEIREEMKRITSPHSLWGAQRLHLRTNVVQERHSQASVPNRRG